MSTKPNVMPSCAWTSAPLFSAFVLIPGQVVRTGRRLVYRLLAWRPDLPVFFRLLDAL
jgi:hypothetical protein